MTLLADLTALLGPSHVITGPDLARYTADWTTHYTAAPLAVVRPGTGHWPVANPTADTTVRKDECARAALLG